MSLRALALDWSIDGPLGETFLVLVAFVGAVYLAAAASGARRDRRGRGWPRGRSVCFIGGLLALVLDLYSGIGTEADVRLSVHMLEHMVLWIVVAPLLAAGAPVRLAFYSLPRSGRLVLARWLRSRAVSAVTGPVGSVSLFSAVLLITHLPAVYGLALSNDYIHEAEHGLYLLTAVLVWAPVLGVDPLPHRPGPRGQLACMAACMLPMVLTAVWLASAPDPVYGHYLRALGPSALADQRLAATIMWAGGLPAFAIPALARSNSAQPSSSAPELTQSFGITGDSSASQFLRPRRSNVVPLVSPDKHSVASLLLLTILLVEALASARLVRLRVCIWLAGGSASACLARERKMRQALWRT